MSDKKCFVIAEIGVNHNGDMNIARQLIDVAADAGADAAKFQTFRADDLIVEGTKAVAYQKKSDATLDQHKLLKGLELSFEDHRELMAHCEARGIEFMSTGFDKGSLRLLLDLGIKRVKIASGEVTNTVLVEASAEACLPIVLSTGMATLEEVAECVHTIRASWDALGYAGDLIVLHCTSAYPSLLEDVNLFAMGTLAQEFGEAVGYSDHTTGILVAPLAVAAGAQLIEKHITLDRTMVGADHAASLEPDELKAMIADIRQVEVINGDGVKAPRAAELEARSLVRKGLKFGRNLSKGHIITEDDLVPMRPETGLPPSRFKSMLGLSLNRDVLAFSPVDEADLG
ncbi:MAG: N-acetylneuraminate synthase [Hyphomicrobiales bacterium]|nr:MAG: N-acetylneuraminate synthase [Hyphomicrobiales bacterium]